MRIDNTQLDNAQNFSAGATWTQGPNPTTASQAAGYGYASFLLGIVGGATSFTSPVTAQELYYGAYFQDTFRVTPKLTLNYGLRYDYQAPRTDRYNAATNFDFTGAVPLNAPGLNLHGVLAFPGTGGLPRGASDPDRNNFAPRFGFAYAFAPKTVFRAGGGVFYSTSHLMADTGGRSGFSTTNNMVTSIDNITPLNYFDNPFPDGMAYPTGNKLGPATLLGQAISFIQRHTVAPYAFQWNAGIQREFPGSVLLDVAYVASRGVKLEDNRQYNQLPDSYLSLGNALNTTSPNPFFGQITTGTLAQANLSRTQLLRPFPQFGAVQSTNTGWGRSMYHSLQVKGEKRFTHGLTFLASYSFSKLMDDVSSSFAGEAVGGTAVQDWNNLRAEWAVSPYDQAHSLACSYIWELPFGPRRRFWSGLRGAPGHIVGGWQVQGVTTFRYGSPLGMLSATNTTGSAGGNQRPNWTGKSANLGDARSVNLWFDPTQFSQPPAFTFGTAPRTLANLRGDGTKNVNFTASKMFRIIEGHNLQFRAEFFNFFNTPRFAPPGQSYLSPTFGIVSTQMNNPRVIQLALKYIF